MSGSTPVSATADLPALHQGAATLPRGVLRRVASRPAGAIGLVLTAAFVVAAALAPLLAPRDPFAVDGPSLAPPSARYLMGTDSLGRDVASGVVHGARTALLVTGTVGLLVLALAVPVGTLAGWRGGRIDDALMRIAEFFQVLPRFFLAIVVIALFGPGLNRLIAVLGITSWVLLARIIRAEVLSLREREFVEAARASGASGLGTVVREILPNALPVAAAYLGLVLAQVLLIEASLGFLGLGDPNVVSWGAMASDARSFARVAWWLPFFPGMAVVLAVLGLNLLADALTAVLARR